MSRRPLSTGLGLACLLLGIAVAASAQKDRATAGRSFDARRNLAALASVPAKPEQAAAIATLRARVPELVAEIDPGTGATRKLQSLSGYLTAPQATADTRQLALDYVARNATLLGLQAADVADLEVTDDVSSPASSVRHLYLRQRHQGLPVFNGQLQVHVERDGRILAINNLFLPDLAGALNRATPAISGAAAIAAAAEHGGYAEPLSSRPIEPRLMILPLRRGEARLVWNFQIWRPGGGDIANFNVDAETGKVWTRGSWVDDHRYEVYPVPVESPNHTTPLPPADGRSSEFVPATAASPFGWHDTDGAPGAESTRTRGNNVRAYTDIDADDTPDAGSEPDCGPALDCSFPLDLTLPPSGYIPAAVVNLFYWNNRLHDLTRPYGFDESSGNFQQNNYGHGGLGGDAVLAEAQDGFSLNNANFGTPVDGFPPRMQMFVWTPANPDRASDLDGGIIAHEYGHGISNRLVGGPSNVDCLDNLQQPGEGLSDWWGLFFTQKNDTSPAARIRGIGTYLRNEPVGGQGVRTDYYDGDPATNAEPQENTWTYASIADATPPHGVGSRWAQAYWEATWALIDEHGFDPDLGAYTGTSADAGNIRAMYYVIEGLKNTVCGPAFTDMRDGILLAAASSYGGEDVCRLWSSFAAFGLGMDAISGGPDGETPKDGFLVPASCRFLASPAPAAAVCAGGTATYDIEVGEAFSPPVTLALRGQPSGTAALFSTNPVPAVPHTVSLQLSPSAGAAAGYYQLELTGTDKRPLDFDLRLHLDVHVAAPAATTTLAPADGAAGQVVQPTFEWSPVAGATSYVLEIAKNPGFAPLARSYTLNGMRLMLEEPLDASTEYFWRVRARNPCGAAADSGVASFTTLPMYCRAPGLAIPDNNPVGVSDVLTLGAAGTVTDVDVLVRLRHSYVGDLVVRLSHVPTGTQVRLLNRPTSGGNCSADDIDAIFDDEASVPPICNSDPAIGGVVRPFAPLAAFDGLARAGNWRLTVNDAAGVDTGELDDWCLIAAALPPPPFFADSFESGSTGAWSGAFP